VHFKRKTKRKGGRGKVWAGGNCQKLGRQGKSERKRVIKKPRNAIKTQMGRDRPKFGPEKKPETGGGVPKAWRTAVGMLSGFLEKGKNPPPASGGKGGRKLHGGVCPKPNILHRNRMGGQPLGGRKKRNVLKDSFAQMRGRLQITSLDNSNVKERERRENFLKGGPKKLIRLGGRGGGQRKTRLTNPHRKIRCVAHSGLELGDGGKPYANLSKRWSGGARKKKDEA